MYATKKHQQSWEALNLKRLNLLVETTFDTSKRSANQFLIIASLITFVLYKLFIISFLILKTIATAKPIIRIEREESWIYRQIK